MCASLCQRLLICCVSTTVQVDFSQLQMNTLRRYKRHFKMQVKPGLNKAQLAEAREHKLLVQFVLNSASVLAI